MIVDFSQRKAALFSGIFIVLMAITAGIVYGILFSPFLSAKDAFAAGGQIQTHFLLFRASIPGWLFILLLDVAAAWSLYFFFKTISPALASLTALLRVVYAFLLGAAIVSLLFALLSPQVTSNPAQQLNLGAYFFLQGFLSIWSLGLIVFGFHLITLGYMTFHAGITPKFWGVLLGFAGLCYVGCHTANLLFPEYAHYKATIEGFLSLPMTIGELGFGIWLIWKGGKA